MNIDEFIDILTVSITAGIISTQAIQYLKDNLKVNNSIVFAIISFFVGSLFAFTFTSFNIKEILWCGFVSIIGVEALYKSFEGKFGLRSSTKKE